MKKNVELAVKRVVYGKAGDFKLHNLEIGKTWNGNFSFESGMGMLSINPQFLFGISTLCSTLSVRFSLIYFVHSNFASFFQNNCKLILQKFSTVKEVTCLFLCSNSKEKYWKKSSFWNSTFETILQF